MTVLPVENNNSNNNILCLHMKFYYWPTSSSGEDFMDPCSLLSTGDQWYTLPRSVVGLRAMSEYFCVFTPLHCASWSLVWPVYFLVVTERNFFSHKMPVHLESTGQTILAGWFSGVAL